MADLKNLARVLLRSDGSVHICFQDIRSIYATPDALVELFSDPIEFIENGSLAYKESSFDINRKRVAMDDILGLTLATVNSDKQIVCHFPELFRYLFAAKMDAIQRTKPLNMKSFELEEILADEKSFLLRYYLEFTSYFKSAPAIKKNIKLREEVQFAIVREILNAFFDEELPAPEALIGLSEKIETIENDNLLKVEAPEEREWVSCQEYAKIMGCRVETIYIYLSKDLIKSAKKDSNGRWLINRNDRPIDWDLRKGRKRKEKKTEGKYYKRKLAGSAADVAEHILKLKLFTAAVAPYIHTFEELNYYTKRSYHEVSWFGRAALIIDVNPDYISGATGIRNRDLMKAGKAPVVPHRDKEEFVYHVHHVGQHSSSPFAIIPEYDHNGKEFSAYFHQGAPNTDLHGPEFEAMKINFWKKYLDEYDKAGGFLKIPYLNSKYKNK